MILPKNFGHYFHVGLTTFWTCIAVWEKLRPRFIWSQFPAVGRYPNRIVRCGL